ncbi:unnamed protein product [Fraxinus pennsylvanica]|uniref:Uncharacterized protein n=1 Tax=Fraxinus pennsylvanica TaxID=56036 RepID=A0AAD2E9P2_9LAMI|nr:unnamed protein product [Fraxinus pennsylvanica]
MDLKGGERSYEGAKAGLMEPKRWSATLQCVRQSYLRNAASSQQPGNYGSTIGKFCQHYESSSLGRRKERQGNSVNGTPPPTGGEERDGEMERNSRFLLQNFNPRRRVKRRPPTPDAVRRSPALCQLTRPFTVLQHHTKKIGKIKEKCLLCRQPCLLNSQTMLFDFIANACGVLNILARSNTIQNFLLIWLDSSSKSICMRLIRRKFKSSRMMQQGDSSITCYMNLRQCLDANSAKALNSDLGYQSTRSSECMF